MASKTASKKPKQALAIRSSPDQAASQGSAQPGKNKPWLWLSLFGLLLAGFSSLVFEPLQGMREEQNARAENLAKLKLEVMAQVAKPSAKLEQLKQKLVQDQDALQGLDLDLQHAKNMAVMAWFVLALSGLFTLLSARRDAMQGGWKAMLARSPWPAIWASQMLVIMIFSSLGSHARDILLIFWLWLGVVLLLPPFMKIRIVQAVAFSALASALMTANWGENIALAWVSTLCGLSYGMQRVFQWEASKAGSLLHTLLVLPWRWVTIPMGAHALDYDNAGWRVNGGRLKSLFVLNLLLGAFVLSALGLSVGWAARWFENESYVKLGLWFLLVVGALAAYHVRAKHGYQAGPLKAKALWALLKAAPLALLGIVLGAYLAGIAFDMAGRVALKKVRAQHEKSGWSLDLPQEPLPLKPERNAAPLLNQAAAFYGAVTASAQDSRRSDDNSVMIALLNQASREGLAVNVSPGVRAALQRHSRALQAWRQAAQRPGLNWGLPFGPPWLSREIPRYGSHMALARMLAAQAIVDAKDGKAAQARADLATITKIAGLFSKDGFIISEMVAVAMQGMVFQAAPGVLQAAAQPARLSEWLPLPKAATAEQRLLNAINLELASLPFDIEALADRYYRPWKPMPSYASDLPAIFSLPYLPFLRLDLASGMRYQSALINALRDKPGLSEADLKRQTQGLRDRAWAMANLALPNYHGLHLKSLKSGAQARILELAMRAREFRQAQGRWPDAAWQLAKGSSDQGVLDPFQQGWLRLAPLGSGLLIYSVGPDQQDDHGAPMRYFGSDERGDISLSLF